MSEDPAESVAQRYARGSTAAAIAIAAFWHVGYDLSVTIGGWQEYRWPLAVAAAWLAYTAIGVVGAFALLNTDRPPPYLWALAGGAIVVDVVLIAETWPDEVLGTVNWGYGSVGWLAVILFWRRGSAELAGFLVLNALIMLAAMASAGAVDRVSLSRYLVVMAGSMTLQFGYSLGGHMLDTAARWAVAGSHARAQMEAWRQYADEEDARRSARLGDLRSRMRELLTRLAEGADPADRELRRECAAAAARLRRLLTEVEDVPDPLLNELRACADVADRRGVIVSLEQIGTPPELPVAIRRALTEAPIEVLSTARTRARITIEGSADEVVVGVVADADDVPEQTVRGVQFTEQREGEWLWIETRWRRG